eukprot:CAMPEP_0184374410 /NCGR_PEP_ID=MMETSP1089-20130417/165011_1 /TAXON_ID=38269 ORGANISM="Gloeochaete wittrockiana, Strain SAG46.84" /NCGR_SAMPLE_ID=MMETSP1089 /ASSEMBLY_ACC=CAM_ASM_000445 /LENGTH=818 /DNA_ID=CAMNT_0026717425 /DNA_START=40 /DNA_END=2496 /DNA_ORIENTATION=+
MNPSTYIVDLDEEDTAEKPVGRVSCSTLILDSSSDNGSSDTDIITDTDEAGHADKGTKEEYPLPGRRTSDRHQSKRPRPMSPYIPALDPLPVQNPFPSNSLTAASSSSKGGPLEASVLQDTSSHRTASDDVDGLNAIPRHKRSKGGPAPRKEVSVPPLAPYISTAISSSPPVASPLSSSSSTTLRGYTLPLASSTSYSASIIGHSSSSTASTFSSSSSSTLQLVPSISYSASMRGYSSSSSVPPFSSTSTGDRHRASGPYDSDEVEDIDRWGGSPLEPLSSTTPYSSSIRGESTTGDRQAAFTTGSHHDFDQEGEDDRWQEGQSPKESSTPKKGKKKKDKDLSASTEGEKDKKQLEKERKQQEKERKQQEKEESKREREKKKAETEKAKAEKKQQKEDAKRKKDEDKAQQAAKARAETLALRQSSGNNKADEICIVLDTAFEVGEDMADLGLKLKGLLHEKSFRSDIQPQPERCSIHWTHATRKKNGRSAGGSGSGSGYATGESQGQDAGSSLPDSQTTDNSEGKSNSVPWNMNFRLLVLHPNAFTALLKDHIQLSTWASRLSPLSSSSSAMGWWPAASEVLEDQPRRLEVVVPDFQSYLRASQSKALKSQCDAVSAGRGASASSEAMLSDKSIQQKLVWLLVKHQITTQIKMNKGEVAEYICGLTKAFADHPYRKELTFLSTAECEVKTVSKDAGLRSLLSLGDSQGDDTNASAQETWTAQLMQLPQVSLARARVISAKYPSLVDLLEAYEDLSKAGRATDGAHLISDLVSEYAGYESSVGDRGTSRRLGPMLSKIVYEFFTASDPKLMLRGKETLE